MANTAPVYARIDNGLKENAEGILAQLGISPSEAIKMLYSQIVLVKGMPFQSKLPNVNRFSAQGITKNEFDAELQKGVDSIKNGRTHSVETVDRILAEEFGI